MKGILERGREFIRYLILIGSVFLIFYAIPKEGRFKYEYNKHEEWKHEDLYAPFSFPIRKTHEELQTEKAETLKNFKPYYILDEEAKTKNLEAVDNIFASLLNDETERMSSFYKILLQKKLLNILSEIYEKGIIDTEPDIEDLVLSATIRIIRSDKSSYEDDIPKLHTEKSAKEQLRDEIRKDSMLYKNLNISNTLALVEANLIFDKQMSSKMLHLRLEEISPTRGMVQSGEKIISKGVYINNDRFQVLESLKAEFELSNSKSNAHFTRYLGYIVLLIILLGGFGVYLWQFYKNIFNSLKNTFFIFLLITSFILISSFVIKTPTLNIYLVPFVVVPILLISFFEARIAFITHLITISIVSLFVPNSFEFLIIQIIAGLTIIISISRIRYISHFFISVLIVMIAYFFTYFGLNLIQVSSLAEISYVNFLWFTGSFLLTLIAYPLIYLFEKVFGNISDITLIELSDINKKLLKDMSVKAPGTFQHSLQVANLSEAILLKIGGNALLAKVGSLYHDIGKTKNPFYFTENQKDYNPHDKLTEKESVAIIIKHVTDGIKLAKEYGLPKEIIEFIKTHHGTSRVEYFYRTFMKNNPDKTVNEDEFRYPGPKPHSKETAVVMIADMVEATARSLKDTSPEIIEKLVDDLVDSKLNDHQLTHANISLKEINIAKEILKNRLKSIYHSRIEYPK